jgi:hypothetical protein
MKVIRNLSVLCLLLFFQNTFAGGESNPVGGRRISLGNAYTGVRGDFWALYANPAGLSGMKDMQAGLFIERRFLVQQLNFGTAAFAMPFKTRHVAGIDFGGFGFGGYTESKVALSYAASVLDNLSLGVKMHYLRTSIPTYGNAGALIIDAGVNAEIAKGLSFGFSGHNLNQARLSTQTIEKEQLPSTLALGLAYQASDKVLIVADIERQVNFPYSFRGGVEYAILPILKARIGAATAPVMFNAGLGLNIKGLEVDWANSFHEYLGYTPSLSLGYRFGKKSEDKKVDIQPEKQP